MVVVDEVGLITCERIMSAKVPNSSFAEVRMGPLIEPTHTWKMKMKNRRMKGKMRETVKSTE